MIEVLVSDYMMMDSLAIWVTEKFDSQKRRVLRVQGGKSYTQEWEEVTDETATVLPTIILYSDAARALLDTLLRHYQGDSDMHTVRADLLHERRRVDKLTDAVIRIASGTGAAE